MSVEILTSDLAEMGFFAVLGLFFLAEFLGVMIIPALKRQGTRVQQKNRGSNLLVISSWIVALIVSQLFAKNDVAVLPSWAYYLGLVVMLTGIAFRQWAIAVLGRYFSGVIGVQEGQRVVESGPYSLIRHPSYTGALLIMVGIGLAMQSWGAVLVIMLVFAISYGHRMLVEEKVLVANLGKSYIEYMGRTKRVIPFLI
ncbi:MAG TPA: isoprenylcysteine carboxylmethyltransferase family protein [Methanomassiliicoccales archaeon]|jgi:protein-S-isoprenylcysteine O-methyltransferase Ste14